MYMFYRCEQVSFRESIESDSQTNDSYESVRLEKTHVLNCKLVQFYYIITNFLMAMLNDSSIKNELYYIVLY